MADWLRERLGVALACLPLAGAPVLAVGCDRTEPARSSAAPQPTAAAQPPPC